MDIEVKDKIFVSKDFALYRNNKTKTISNGIQEFSGNVLCNGNGFIQIIGSGQELAVLTHIDFNKLKDNFEYTIISFKDMQWLKYYIDSLSNHRKDTIDIIKIFEIHLEEIKTKFLIGFDNLNLVTIEGNYKHYGAFQKHDAEVFKAIKIAKNIDEWIKDKIKICSLIIAYFARKKLTYITDFSCSCHSYDLIGLGKPIAKKR